jgi:hypothetical protein
MRPSRARVLLGRRRRRFSHPAPFRRTGSLAIQKRPADPSARSAGQIFAAGSLGDAGVRVPAARARPRSESHRPESGYAQERSACVRSGSTGLGMPRCMTVDQVGKLGEGMFIHARPARGCPLPRWAQKQKGALTRKVGARTSLKPHHCEALAPLAGLWSAPWSDPVSGVARWPGDHMRLLPRWEPPGAGPVRGPPR